MADKCAVSGSPFFKRRHFALQKAVFRALKGRLLQAKRRHIGKALTVNELQSGDDVC